MVVVVALLEMIKTPRSLVGRSDGVRAVRLAPPRLRDTPWAAENWAPGLYWVARASGGGRFPKPSALERVRVTSDHRAWPGAVRSTALRMRTTTERHQTRPL